MSDTLEKKECWNGKHRGISFEIIHWHLGWNYYVLIPLEQLPDSKKEIFNLEAKVSDLPSGRSYFDYWVSPLKDFDWHGGLTLYEKYFDDFGKVDGFRLGCDYMHLWDEGLDYTLETVAEDARHTIDKIWEAIPDLKMRCSWDGKFYNQEDTCLSPRGEVTAKVNMHNYKGASHE